MPVLTLDTFWQVAAWQFYMLFVPGGLGSLFALLRGWNFVLSHYQWPDWIGKYTYHIFWYSVYIQWGISAFWVWWTADPLAPTISGKWDLWFVNLAFISILPIVSFFHFLAGWIFMAWWLAFTLLLVLLGFEIVAFLLTWLIEPTLLIPGLLFIWSMFVTFIMLIFTWQIWRCYRPCDYNNLKKIWFCSCMKDWIPAAGHTERAPAFTFGRTQTSGAAISSGGGGGGNGSRYDAEKLSAVRGTTNEQKFAYSRLKD